MVERLRSDTPDLLTSGILLCRRDVGAAYFLGEFPTGTVGLVAPPDVVTKPLVRSVRKRYRHAEMCYVLYCVCGALNFEL